MSNKIGFYGGETFSSEDASRECMRILEEITDGAAERLANAIDRSFFDEVCGQRTYIDTGGRKISIPSHCHDYAIRVVNNSGKTAIEPPSRETVHSNEPKMVEKTYDDQTDHEPLYCIGDVVELHSGGIGVVSDISFCNIGILYTIEHIKGYVKGDKVAWWKEDEIKSLLVISVRELCAIEHAKYMEDYRGENNV